MDGPLDESRRVCLVGEIAGVGLGLPAVAGQLVSYLGGGRRALEARGGRRTDVVDDHGGAETGELRRMAATQAAARAGDDGDLAVESMLSHTGLSSDGLRRGPARQPPPTNRDNPALIVYSRQLSADCRQYHRHDAEAVLASPQPAKPRSSCL
jgi:hypothetical protein